MPSLLIVTTATPLPPVPGPGPSGGLQAVEGQATPLTIQVQNVGDVAAHGIWVDLYSIPEGATIVDPVGATEIQTSRRSDGHWMGRTLRWATGQTLAPGASLYLSPVFVFPAGAYDMEVEVGGTDTRINGLHFVLLIQPAGIPPAWETWLRIYGPGITPTINEWPGWYSVNIVVVNRGPVATKGWVQARLGPLPEEAIFSWWYIRPVEFRDSLGRRYLEWNTRRNLQPGEGLGIQGALQIEAVGTYTLEATVWASNTPPERMVYNLQTVPLGTLPPPPPPPPPIVGTLQGIVVDGVSGAPIPQAQVSADTGAVTTTDQAGFYRLTEVSAGRRTVQAQHPLYQTATAQGNLAEGGTLTLDFTLVPLAAPPPPPPPPAPGTATIQGTVRDQVTQGPIAGAQVSVDTGEVVTTDQGGFYRLEGVAPGPRAIQVIHALYMTVLAEVTLEEGQVLDLNFELAPTAAPPPGGPAEAGAGGLLLLGGALGVALLAALGQQRRRERR